MFSFFPNHYPYRDWKLISCALFYCIPLYLFILKHSLSLSLLFTDCLDLLAIEIWRATYFYFSSLEHVLAGINLTCILRIRQLRSCLHCRYFTNWGISQSPINLSFRISFVQGSGSSLGFGDNSLIYKQKPGDSLTLRKHDHYMHCSYRCLFTPFVGPERKYWETCRK